MSNKKICPVMTHGIWTNPNEEPISGAIPCQQGNCQLWITVYTTENTTTEGCCHELLPQMVDGQLRV